MKKYFSFVLTLVMLITLTGPVQSASAAGTMRFNKTSISIGINEPYQQKIISTTKKIIKADVKWSSADNGIASVNNYGVITGKMRGKTKIYAVVSGKTLNCVVHVNPSRKNITDTVNNFGIEYLETDGINCIITNDSEIDIVTGCNITFYKGSIPVSLQNSSAVIFAKSKQVIKFNKIDKEYDSYKVTFSNPDGYAPTNLSSKVSVTGEFNSYEYYKNNTDVNSKSTVSLLDLSINNTTNDILLFVTNIIYYKNNSIVYIQNYNGYNIHPGDNMIWNSLRTETFDADKILAIPDYDKYEIIYSAYKY